MLMLMMTQQMMMMHRLHHRHPSHRLVIRSFILLLIKSFNCHSNHSMTFRCGPLHFVPVVANAWQRMMVVMGSSSDGQSLCCHCREHSFHPVYSCCCCCWLMVNITMSILLWSCRAIRLCAAQRSLLTVFVAHIKCLSWVPGLMFLHFIIRVATPIAVMWIGCVCVCSYVELWWTGVSLLSDLLMERNFNILKAKLKSSLSLLVESLLNYKLLKPITKCCIKAKCSDLGVNLIGPMYIVMSQYTSFTINRDRIKLHYFGYFRAVVGNRNQRRHEYTRLLTCKQNRIHRKEREYWKAHSQRAERCFRRMFLTTIYCRFGAKLRAYLVYMNTVLLRECI